MLVLTRKPQEKICIGENIVVTVLRTKGKAVRIGIEAPHDMRVLRGEIAFDAPQREETLAETQEETGRALHTRMSRADATAALPQLAAGTGPLSAMLHSTTVDIG